MASNCCADSSTIVLSANMPKKRIIACLTVKDGIVVQSIGFEKYLPVGRADIAARFLDDWGVDEIVLVDIRASAEKRLISTDLVRAVSQSCYVPVTAGGGIRTSEDIRTVLQAGADKISVNSLALDGPETMWQASRTFGRQCIVASIDVEKDEHGAYRVFSRTSQAGDLDPVDCAKRAEDAGAGEILLNSVERDGIKEGYDLEILERVAEAINIPVIALGGAGHPDHFAEALKQPFLSAAAAGNFFHFTEHSVATLKSYLVQHGHDVRLESQAAYAQFAFQDSGRAAKRPDEQLVEMIFEHIPEEVI